MWRGRVVVSIAGLAVGFTALAGRGDQEAAPAVKADGHRFDEAFLNDLVANGGTLSRAELAESPPPGASVDEWIDGALARGLVSEEDGRLAITVAGSRQQERLYARNTFSVGLPREGNASR
jgi:hypothetical protein